MNRDLVEPTRSAPKSSGPENRPSGASRWRPRTIQGQAFLFLIALSLVAVLRVFSSIFFEVQHGNATNHADMARQLQLHVETLSDAMVNQETGVRGYAATGDRQFLGPYNEGRAEAPTLLHQIKLEMPPAKRSQLLALNDSIMAWQKWAEMRVTEIAASGNPLNIEQVVQGEQLFDRYRTVDLALDKTAAQLAAAELASAATWANAQLLSSIVALALTLGIIGLLGGLFTRSILRPLRGLVMAAIGLAAGAPAAIQTLQRDDEVGDLGRALESWRLAVDERANISRAMVEVSEAIDLENILELSGSRLLQVLNAAEVVITLSEGAERRVLFAHPHPFDSGSDLPQHSPSGHALDTGQPLVADVRHGEWDPRIETWRDQHKFGPVLAMPLISSGETLGAATVLRYAAGPQFDQADLQRAELMLPYLAAALHVNRLFTEVRVMNEELAQASRRKGEFLANMSHELRTPLNSILGFSQMAIDFPARAREEANVERYMRNINSSGTHMLGLINDLLDVAKIEAGKMELNRQKIPLADVLDPVLATLEPLAAKKSIDLISKAPSRLALTADPLRLKQVLLNLLSNAVKFTPEHGRVIVGAEQSNGSVRITVEDSGIGIPEDDQSKIFDEFQQAGNSNGNSQGTGLGLSLTKRFVELHGGTITVKSHLGIGSTFVVTLPG